MDLRKQRIARNEASFREINERLSQALRQVPDNPELLEFICECGHRTCEQHVALSLSEYEDVRLDSRRFAVVPGHVIPDTESVVASSDRFDVVEKLGEAIDVADATDLRTLGSTGRRDNSR